MAKKQTFYFSDCFTNFRPVNKRINQSQWLCGADVTSVSHNNIKTMADKLIVCLSAPSVFLTNTQITKTTNLTYGRESPIRWALQMVSVVTLCSLLLDELTYVNVREAMLTFHQSWLTSLLIPVTCGDFYSVFSV